MNWKESFGFKGRIDRKTFWGNLYILGVIGIIAEFILPEMKDGSEHPAMFVFYIIIGYLSMLLCVKRCHDRNKSSWWFFILYISIIGQVWLFIELGFLPGTKGPNRFGTAPLYHNS